LFTLALAEHEQQSLPSGPVLGMNCIILGASVNSVIPETAFDGSGPGGKNSSDLRNFIPKSVKLCLKDGFSYVLLNSNPSDLETPNLRLLSSSTLGISQFCHLDFPVETRRQQSLYWSLIPVPLLLAVMGL